MPGNGAATGPTQAGGKHTLADLPTSPTATRITKRARQNHGGADDSEDDRGVPRFRRTSKAPADAQEKPRHVACPFFKFNPGKYRHCLHHKPDGINRVKQHILRRHTPFATCHRCYATFSDAEEAIYRSHIDAVSCHRNPAVGLEVIDQFKARRLSRRFRGSIEDRWYAMWDILFPGEPRPSSVYVDDLSEDFCLMREFQEQRGVAILVEELRAMGGMLRPEVSESDLRRVLRRGINAMYEHYLRGLTDGLPNSLPTPMQSSSPSSQGAHIAAQPGEETLPDSMNDGITGVGSGPTSSAASLASHRRFDDSETARFAFLNHDPIATPWIPAMNADSGINHHNDGMDLFRSLTPTTGADHDLSGTRVADSSVSANFRRNNPSLPYRNNVDGGTPPPVTGTGDLASDVTDDAAREVQDVNPSFDYEDFSALCDFPAGLNQDWKSM